MKKQIIYRGSKLSFTDVGAEIPVLLLHGFGEDSRVWEQQADYLSPHVRLLIPDIPGSGNSEFIPGELKIADYAECIHRIIEAEKISSFTMIGHSMGGYITLAYAEKYGAFLRGFGLVHSTAFADSPEKIEARKKGIDFILRHGAFPFLRQTLPNLFTEEFRQKEPEIIESYIEAAKPFSSDSLIQYYSAMISRPDRTAILKTFPKPVLLIIGKEDKTVNLQDSLAQSHLPVQSHVHILKYSAHMGMLEEKDRCNEIILNYLRQVNEN